MPFAVFARTLLVPTQPVSPYLDTEVSTNCVLHRSRIDARTFDVHFQFEGTPTNNLEVAFGRDSNTNGVLDVQEIDTAYGWRGGRYFIENVRAWERIETVAATNALWNPPVAEGDQVGRMSEANEPRSGLKSPRPHFDPTDVYWPDENRACIGDEITWKIEPHETPTRKETNMNKLKNEVRAIIENYNPKADFEETLLKLASVGYKMEETMMHT